LDEAIAAFATELGRHDLALERRLVLAEREQDALGRARALLEAAKSASSVGDRERARGYLDGARADSEGDELFDLELDIEQAAIDWWGDRPKRGGRTLARDAARRASRLFQTDVGARRPFLEALRVEYEAAYQEDDLETMVRAAEERSAVARGFDDDAYLTALLASARALRRIGRLDEALTRTEAVWDEARKRVLPRLALDAGYWLTFLLLQSGRVADAEDALAAVAELASRIGDEARARHSIERLAAEVDFHGSDWRGGVERLLAPASSASEHGRVELHQLAALWLALAGGEALANDVLAQLATARACADRAGCPRCATELRLATADALAHVGRRSDASSSLLEWSRMQSRPQPR